MTTRLHSRPPMTADEARENVAEMQRKTSRRSAIQLYRHALGGFGNLSDEAREVYRAELARLEGK